MGAPAALWDGLAEEFKESAAYRKYILESVKQTTIEEAMTALDEARETSGMSKADIARVIDANPATIRRFFSGKSMNPTLGTLTEIAAALGLRVRLEPLPEAEIARIVQPLLNGVERSS
ncbi:XRE family transcriptional regulator [Arthrobacter sp. MYb227]|uniref:helix-turn-helix domain-containing protein n=1 Tax=Arthrobacter sp. MYb227 TaxID=1848601 RepID=UPI000CFB72E5|nr:helix-turn-helix transcriptional regulator [Arthrobacter sp. MYb227]PQZ89065.1 XRE family transcriptional regulator [Arthrobacter sp. MYb227]